MNIRKSQAHTRTPFVSWDSNETFITLIFGMLAAQHGIAWARHLRGYQKTMASGCLSIALSEERKGWRNLKQHNSSELLPVFLTQLQNPYHFFVAALLRFSLPI